MAAMRWQSELKRRPGKWIPVFRSNAAKIEDVERHADSRRTRAAPASVARWQASMVLVAGLLAAGILVADRPDVVRSVSAFMRPPSPPRMIVINEPITPVLRDRLLASRQAPFDMVLLDSPGGDVTAAIDLAKVIRARNATTHVGENGRCFSACTVLYQSGVRRTAAPSALFLLHYAVQESDDPNIVVRGGVWGTVALIEALIEFGASQTIYDQIPSLGDWLLSADQAREINMVQAICERPAACGHRSGAGSVSGRNVSSGPAGADRRLETR